MIYKYEKRSYKTFFRRKNSRRFIKNELRSGTRAKKRRNEIYQLKIPIDLLPGLGFRWWQSWWRLTRGRTWSRGRHAICSRILRYRVSRNNSVFFPWIFKILPALPHNPALGAAICRWWKWPSNRSDFTLKSLTSMICSLLHAEELQ